MERRAFLMDLGLKDWVGGVRGGGRGGRVGGGRGYDMVAVVNYVLALQG